MAGILHWQRFVGPGTRPDRHRWRNGLEVEKKSRVCKATGKRHRSLVEPRGAATGCRPDSLLRGTRKPFGRNIADIAIAVVDQRRNLRLAATETGNRVAGPGRPAGLLERARMRLVALGTDGDLRLATVKRRQRVADPPRHLVIQRRDAVPYIALHQQPVVIVVTAVFKPVIDMRQ